MTETERLLQRQAEWQRARQARPWPEKLREAERLRSTVEAFRAQRERRPEAPGASIADTGSGVPGAAPAPRS